MNRTSLINEKARFVNKFNHTVFLSLTMCIIVIMSTRILYIGNRLAQHGYTATTIDTLGTRLEETGYDLRYASSQRAIIARMIDMLWTTFTSRKWAEIVLIDTYSTRNFWYAILVSRLCELLGLSYIPILHGGNLPDRINSHPHAVHRLMKKAQVVVSPSDYLKTAFAKAKYDNITIIPNSITIEDYPFQLREKISPRLLWVRSFAAIYNPQMAIYVFEKIKQSYPDAALTMVGPEKDGSMVACQQLAEELQLEVTFTGKLTREQWIELSRSCDLFLNTTNFDNLPVSIIEAMALGIPVVSTNVGGMPYLVIHKENGLLVPANDIDNAVAVIKELLNTKELAISLSQNGRKTASNYSWLQVKQLWDGVLKG